MTKNAKVPNNDRNARLEAALARIETLEAERAELAAALETERAERAADARRLEAALARIETLEAERAASRARTEELETRLRAANIATNAPPTNQANVHNIVEKCRKFLANLLELASREPEQVAQNVCTLIQELIDAIVEPDEFFDRLGRLLNVNPQPCLSEFFKKGIPLLRKSLCTKELSIEGVKPPPHSVAFGASDSRSIQAQVDP